MNNDIYQIKIELKHSKPKIWRRVLVPSNMGLEDLHYIIQKVMGWENCHLHQFMKNNTCYLPEEEAEDAGPFSRRKIVDYTDVLISTVFENVKDKIEYEYDFGDSWEHHVTLEKILPYDSSKQYPICIKGKNACPPEDCGGIWGYYNVLETLNDPKHENYEDYKYWYGNIDTEKFDLDEINARLNWKS